VFGSSSKPELAPGDGFNATTRRRLDLFAQLFDDIAEPDLPLFAGPEEPGPELASAMQTADQALGSGTEREATKRAVQDFVHAAQLRFIENFNVLSLLGVGSRSRPSSDDRTRIFKSLERAVVAIVVWDRLDPADQAALAGPWGEMVERAVEGR